MAKEKPGPEQDVDASSAENASATEKAVRKAVSKARTPKAKRKVGRKKKTGRTAKAEHAQESESADRGKWSRRQFPQNTLQDALAIAQAIKEKTNGNPCDTELLAKAVDLSKQGGKFYYLCASARDYGLTIGSRDTAQIALDEIGRAIVFAPDPASRRSKQIEAFFKIDKFKKVFEFYGGSSAMPEAEFVSNVLQNQFGLDTSEHEEFIDLFRRNCEFLGIAEGLGGVPPPTSGKDKQDSVDITIVGQPRGKFDRTAFVIMPFSKKVQRPVPRASLMRFSGA